MEKKRRIPLRLENLVYNNHNKRNDFITPAIADYSPELLPNKPDGHNITSSVCRRPMCGGHGRITTTTTTTTWKKIGHTLTPKGFATPRRNSM
jgi:hypothetical protein